MVKEVFVRYLWNLGKRPVPRKKNVPGPDVIIGGYAYECKGSRFEKSALFKQLVSYALQYSGVGVVLPWDSLDCLFIHQLEALEVLLSKHSGSGRSVETYVIAQEGGMYFLRRWASARLLSLEISRAAYELAPELSELKPEEVESKVLEFLSNFDQKVREHIKKMVVEGGRNPPNPWEGFSCLLDEA